ncbi:chromatin modification- protein VID21, partial [Coemansia spiralis]
TQPARVQLERRRLQLLHEYYFWANAQDGDVARALEASTYAVLGSTERGAGLAGFVADYARDPAAALAAMKDVGEDNWRASLAPLLAPAEATAHSAPDDASERMEVDSDDADTDRFPGGVQADSEVVDTTHITHPDNIVFLSQLDPVPDAEVVSRCRVQGAEMLENSALLFNYQGLVDDLNGKSVSMYRWMLHAQEQPLHDIVGRSGKLVSTRDWDAVRNELTRVRVMERIEELKEKKKWSFWQPRKHRAPPRSKAHWDHILAEMAWMHTDFAEERKLRAAMARMVSAWVMDYHQAADKSRYTVAAQRRLLPDEFIRSAAPRTSGSTPEAKSATEAPEALGALETSSEASEEEGDDESEEVGAPVVPRLEADGGDQPATETEPVAVKEEPMPQGAKDPAPVAGAAVDSSDAGLAAPAPKLDSDSSPTKDHAVSSDAAPFEAALSVFHVLAQLPECDGLEDILGDSVHALQALSTLAPYAPAWDEPYCDVLDASPVVPICKTMWPDFEITNASDNSDDESACGLPDGFGDSIDIHELLRLGADNASGVLGDESDRPGGRSIFARSVMAPSMLPMFTQANKPLRATHSSAGQPPADTTAQQAIIDACPGQAVFEWSAERDRVLAKVVQQYTGNWPLIVESFNHAAGLYGSRALGSRACFERWVAIKDDYSLDRATVQTGFDEPDFRPRRQLGWASHLAVQPTAVQLSAMQLATHVVAHSEALKAVSESKQKKDLAPTPASVPPRDIRPLAADQRVPTPAELSRLKVENDRRLQQILLEHRQAMPNSAALAMQQQRALHPQMQLHNISRQIEMLQAMIASGRGPQRPLTEHQSRMVQQQLRTLQHQQQL